MPWKNAEEPIAMHAMLPRLNPDASEFPPLRRGALQTLQVNLGYRCNQQCLHCHVNAGPKRKEVMSDDTVDAVLDLLRRSNIKQLDLTGGAPELHPRFRDLVSRAAGMGVHVIDRCNLTILSEPGQEGLAAFLAEHRVEVVASLPCYLAENVDGQRGRGVFAGSLAGLKQLNAVGYGEDGLPLRLMYNPLGPYLPPPQQALEDDYRKKLAEHGVSFTSLLTLVNMPIQRFGSMLVSKGQFDDYMALLRDSYSPANLQRVMCRSLVSIDWQGFVYDCDFNQMLGIPAPHPGRMPLHLRDLDPAQLTGRPIAVADHCYGCTAGQGSSCSGALSEGGDA
jgi:radical SAM/Cys-rich protein